MKFCIFRKSERRTISRTVQGSGPGGTELTGNVSCMQRLAAEVSLAQIQRRYLCLADSDAGRVDVRQHLRALESGILEGVIICFTSVIPSTDTDAASHPCWRLAEKVARLSWCMFACTERGGEGISRQANNILQHTSWNLLEYIIL